MKTKIFLLFLILSFGVGVSSFVFGGNMSFKTDIQYV